MIPVQVDKISFHPPSNSYAVVLKELDGMRKLPVIVGAFEAQAIALAMENIQTPRPMTHDLLSNMIIGIDGTLLSVMITELKDGIYYAKLEIGSKHFDIRAIDARPSDAIALALRMQTTILVASTVMDESGVLEDREQEGIESHNAGAFAPSKATLEKQLADAVEKEEYEIAAKLRDQIRELSRLS